MNTSEKIKRSEDTPVLIERGLNLLSASKDVKKLRDHSVKWSKTNKKFIKTAIETAVDTYLVSNIQAPLSTKAGKNVLSNIILTNIGTTFASQIKSSAPTADLVISHESSEDHLQMTEVLGSIPIQRAQIPTNPAVNEPAIWRTGDCLSNQIKHLPLRAKHLGSFNDEVVIKKEKVDEPERMTMSDPAVFTIRLGIANDNSFAILFNDKRVVEGLGLLSPREKLQLIHDAIYHDPEIPNRTLTCPWITHVKQLNDGCLTFRTGNKNDVHTVTTNVQWARSIRDTIAAGIKTYKLVIKESNILRLRTENYEDTATIINEIRKENTERVPSITQFGAVRDVMLQEGQVQEIQLGSYVQYIVTFGSREAANAALDMGLIFYSKYCTCVTYSPITQWHQQCSNCQRHGHIAKDCLFQSVCGKCSSNHLTQNCKSVVIECANCHGRHVAVSKTCLRWLEAEDKAHRAYRFPAEEFSMPQTHSEAKATLPPPASPQSVHRKPEELRDKPPKTALTSSKPPPTARKQISQLTAVNLNNESTSSATPSTFPQSFNQPSTAPKHISQQAPVTRNKESTASTAPSTPLQTSSQPPTAPKHIPQPAATTSSPEPSSSTTAPSALLETIDAFRAFVAARENESSKTLIPSQKPAQATTQNLTQKKRKMDGPPQQEHEYKMTGALQVDGHGGKRVKRGEEAEGEGPVWPIGQSGYVPPSLMKRR